MPVTIRHRFEIDEGTKSVELIGPESVDLSGDLEGPTGMAESTLVREVTATEHEDEPTGAAKLIGEETRTADWPKPVETKTASTSAKKTTQRKATVRRAEKTTARKSTRGKK